MREILFRAKDLKGNWRTGYYWYDNMECCHRITQPVSKSPSFSEPGGENYNEHYMVDPATIGQYTGVKLDDGTKIFESDILEFNEREWGGKDNIHVVSWDENEAEWCWGGGTTSDMEWRKIIGNIHDNPELLY